MPVGGILTAIRQEREATSALAHSVYSDGATLKPVQVSGVGGVTELNMSRHFDAGTLRNLVRVSAAAGQAEAINDLAGEISAILGKVDDTKSITGKMNSMLDALNITDVTDEARSKAVAAVTSFFTQAESDKAKIEAIEQKAEDRISETVSSINATLRKIFDSNKRILDRDVRSDNPARTVSENELVELSKLLGAGYNISHGKVLVTADFGNVAGNIVDNTSFVQLSYSSDRPGEITYAFHDHSGKTSADNTVTIAESGEVLISSQGKLQGLIEFRETILKTSVAEIDKAMSDVAYGINVVHNKGSGFPPSTLTSSKEFKATDDIGSSSGTMVFAPVGVDGAASEMLPIKLDLTKVTDIGGLARAVTKEGECPASAGVGFGRNIDNQGNGRLLIRQAALELDEIVNSQGSMRLRLESGSDYGAKVRINQVVLDDGVATVAVQNVPTTWAEVKAGEVTLTPEFAFTLPGAPTQNMQVAMVLEIVGTDGTTELVQVSYQINAGAGNTLGDYTSNSYHQAEDSTAGAFAGFPGVTFAPGAALDAIPTAAQSTSPAVSAGLVGDNVMFGGSFTIVGDAKINGEDIVSYLGLNDLVVKGTDGKWKVRDDIVSDPRKLALAKPQKQPDDLAQDTLTGVTAATAALRLGAVVPAAGDTVTINGEQFTFINSPAANNPNQILIAAGNQQQTMMNLYNALISGNFPKVSDVVDVSVPAGGNMVITARNTGIAGNGITIVSAIVDMANGVVNAWTNAQRLGDGAAVAGDRLPATTLYGGISNGPVNGTGIASAQFSLVAGKPANNDTIVINGRTIEFVNAPGPGQVLIGGTTDATIANLQAALTNGDYPELTGLMTFAVNAANASILDVTSVSAGSHGNNIKLTTALANGVWGNAANALPAGGAANLVGGLDAAGTRTSKRFGWDVVAGNNYNALEFLNPIQIAVGNVTTLKGAFMRPMIDLKTLVENYESDFKVSSEVADQAKELFSSKRKLDDQEVLILISRSVQRQRMLLAVQRLWMEGRKLTVASAA